MMPINTDQNTAMEAELERLTYIISHDLREPVRMVNSFLGILDEQIVELDDPDAKKYLAYAKDGGERLSYMLEAIVKLARTGKKKERRESQDVGAFLSNRLNFTRANHPDTNIECVVASSAHAMLDRDEIEWLIDELAANAGKYQPNGQAAKIQFECTHDKENVFIRCIDNGIGIDANQHERVVRLFQRLHNRSEYAGIGAGLAIAQRIAQVHEGELIISARDDQQPGSCFTLRLPTIEPSNAN